MSLNSFQTSGNSPGATQIKSPADRDSRCQVGLLGFGPLGAAVARRLTGPDAVSPLTLTHIYDRRARERRVREADAISSLSWTDRLDDLLSSDTDVIVEALTAGEPTADYVRAALLAGKSVVTASRQVMAHQGPSLLTLAERQGRQLRYEAALGGAIPLVRALGDGLSGDRILAVDGVLNGTTTAVLSRMAATGCTLDEAIAEACAGGYAESDPSVDLDGLDAAAKLTIVCALAFGVRVRPDAIDTRTTVHVTHDDLRQAQLRGGTIRQVAHASYARSRQSLTAWVAPIFVPGDSPLARTEGPQNAVVINCQHAGAVVLSGTGAGTDAIATAIIGDLRTISRDRAAIVPAPVLVEPQSITGRSDQTFAEAV